MKAVIVAKTRMGCNFCIGAVDTTSHKLLRLIPRKDPEFHSWSKFKANVGSIVNFTGTPSPRFEAPHVEDFLVNKYNRIGTMPNLPSWIRKNCTVWTGDLSQLFDGKMKFTSKGKGHIDRGAPLPSSSVGFWEIPSPMMKILVEDKIRFNMYSQSGQLLIDVPFVGADAITLPQQLDTGTLVRVSLSRWLPSRTPAFDDACWLQLSGYYSG